MGAEEGYTIRPADRDDLPGIARVYDEIHTWEEAGKGTIGWNRKVYPTAETARAALSRGDIYVLTVGGEVAGTAIINASQVDVYAQGDWSYPARDEEVLVLHTLVISPRMGGKGLGKAFVAYYEDLARKRGCKALRMDTNARNEKARGMYQHLGYREAGIIPCTFNGLPGVDLVLLEKRL